MDQPKIKILLVDDEDFVRELLARYLKGDARLQIDEASDGFTAVSKTIMKSYHLAILDVAMPHFNGIEAIKNMQANCPELKFIIVTGLGNKEMLEDCRRLGCQVILQKPVEKETLLQAVYGSIKDELETMSNAA